ncbi:MAG: succinate dehydrogenase assembly factor 2 [Gallionellaceae bacterium]|nr:succinate dehydrogenase assembly factor 2 [Gallionellaceae bacterium]
MSDALNRLRWRCQRGMLELDHILRGFLDTAYPDAAPATQRAFEALLAMADADMLDLIMGRTEARSAEMADLLILLRRHE